MGDFYTPTGVLGTGSVGTAQIAANAVTAIKIAAGVIDPTKLSFNPARWLDKNTTFAQVVNTLVETNLYSFSVPGGTLGTSGIIRHTLVGTYFNNSGGAVTFTWRAYYGGFQIFGSPGVSRASSAAAFSFGLVLYLVATGATNTQIIGGWFDDEAASSGIPAATATPLLTIGASIGTDSTVAQTLRVTGQMGTAAATINISFNGAVTELLA